MAERQLCSHCPPIDTRYLYRLLRREPEPPRGGLRGGGDRDLDPVHGRALTHVALDSRVEDVHVGALPLALGPPALGRERDPRRHAVRQTQSSSSSVPTSFGSRHLSPSAETAAGGVGGVQRDRRAGPSRLVILGSLAKLSFSIHGDAGDSSRSRPPAGALVGPRLRQPRVAVGLGGRRGDLDPAARRRELEVGELHHRLGGERHRPHRGQLLEARRSRRTARPAARRSSRASDSCSSGSVKPIAVASRRKISWFGQRLAERLDRLHLRRQR